MEKCRICLGNRKNLLSIFATDGNLSYANMITSLAKVKITKEDRINDKLCRSCLKKLKESYDFKVLIERSDTILCETNHLKKIVFNNLEDIKIKVEIENDDKKKPKQCEVVKEYFKNGINEISYSNTVIKRLQTCDDNVNTNHQPIPVLDFLKGIKEEPEYDYTDNYEIDQYGSDYGDEEYIPPYKLLKNHKYKNKKDKVINNNKKRNIQNKTKRICIKPVYLKDLKLIYSKPELKPKRNKKKVQKLEMCPHCGKMSTGLKTHLLQHTGEKKFKCDKCGKGYYTPKDLAKHVKSHSTLKDFKCELCVAAFIDKATLRSHMVSHTNERKFVCEICSKGFKRRCALNRHRLMHNSANKTIMCEQCNMSFFTKFGLTHHMRVHTRERPYNCEICSQPYSYKRDFNRHCFKKHGVFLKRRSVCVMNEEVLKKEKILMRDLMLRVQGVVGDGTPLNPFDGPQGAQAFEQAVKELQSGQIPADF